MDPAGGAPLMVFATSSTDGLSFSSALVFAGGVLAALGAVIAALVTARAAERRLEKTLGEERERAEQRTRAEADRINRQLAHDRFLVRRTEASTAIEQVARLVARSVARAGGIVGRSLRGADPDVEELRDLNRHLDELREEVNVLALRFGRPSEVVQATSRVVEAMSEAIASDDEGSLTEEGKQEMLRRRRAVNGANGDFLISAREAIDAYE